MGVEERARALHGRGVAAIAGDRPEEGARLLRTGLRLLGDGAHEALAARLLISLAAAEVKLGRSERGFELLDRAVDLVAPEDRGILLDQRGWLFMYVGRMDEALRCMDDAIPLHEATSDVVRLARGLLNRAMLHELAGRVRLARSDLERCERLVRSADQPRLLAKVRLNLGHCEVLAGDIPAALRSFESARSGLAEHAPNVLPVLAVDMARALLDVGLPTEAAVELDFALGALGRSETTHERAEAELTRAQTAVAQGDLPVARQWARRAERRFRRRGNATWAALAVLTRLRADFAGGRPVRAVAAHAATLADELRELGLRDDAEVATALAARARVVSGDLDRARAHLSGGRTAHLRLETKLVRHLASAELHAAEGDNAKTYAHARAGLALLREHRGRLGSVDLQTGTAGLGMDLARLGLVTSLRGGRPRVVFDWLERSRAQAFQVRPVRPPADPATTDDVAALRQAAVTARAAELAGTRDLVAERRCAELERSIRSRGWQADGSGEHAAAASFRDVADTLAHERSVLVSFLVDGADLRALVIADGVGRLVPAGRMAAVREVIARLRSDLDAMCGRRLPPAVAAVVEASVHHQLATLNENLLAPLRSALGDRDLVVVPTGPLSAVPWNLLPDLRGRPVTVAVSASTWCHTVRRPASPAGAPLLVAGPNLAHAADEVGKIAELFRERTVLAGSEATVAATLEQLDGRRSVHFAAHGHHEPGNVFFSRLDLADGPLMAYDIHQLRAVPEHVVLSSCDIGRTLVRRGDEMLGFTAALLYSGTRTVIASVARVPDAAALGVMAAYQELYARGVPPAKALAEASLLEPLIPLVCFGCG
jgi:hypothetical protein